MSEFPLLTIKIMLLKSHMLSVSPFNSSITWPIFMKFGMKYRRRGYTSVHPNFVLVGGREKMSGRSDTTASNVGSRGDVRQRILKKVILVLNFLRI